MKRLLTLLALATLVACGSPGTAGHQPVLRSNGTESPVAVTVAGGSETLPVWQRAQGGSGEATLVVPADLLFARDSSTLSPAAATVLQLVVAELVPGGHVLVEGHADSDGEASYNRALSERRAQAVADWLGANAAVPRSAIEIKGWGEDRPAVDGFDEAAKAQNRRVVVTVTPAPASPVGAVRAPEPTRRT
jgi:outer membrane protein OmpA-like peptidoglycan-associated protein